MPTLGVPLGNTRRKTFLSELSIANKHLRRNFIIYTDITIHAKKVTKAMHALSGMTIHSKHAGIQNG